MKIQKGFTAIEGLLLLVIAGMLGGVGWYIWNTNNQTNNSSDNASAANTLTTAHSKKGSSALNNPTVDWVSYSGKEGKFSLKYPKSWARAHNHEACRSYIILLGANKDTVGACNSDGVGQIFVMSLAGNYVTNNEIKDGYTKVTKQDITLDNVKGIKMTGEATGKGESLFAQPAGTKITLYIFYTNNRTYVAEYIQRPSYPDVRGDFNIMVTKTLKFSS